MSRRTSCESVNGVELHEAERGRASRRSSARSRPLRPPASSRHGDEPQGAESSRRSPPRRRPGRTAGWGASPPACAPGPPPRRTTSESRLRPWGSPPDARVRKAARLAPRSPGPPDAASHLDRGSRVRAGSQTCPRVGAGRPAEDGQGPRRFDRPALRGCTLPPGALRPPGRGSSWCEVPPPKRGI